MEPRNKAEVESKGVVHGVWRMEREELEEEVGISGGCIWVDKHTIYRDRRLGGKHEEGRR